MQQSIRRISTHELLPFVEEIIQSGRKARITVTGNSMRPFIVSNRDEVLITGFKALKKGDIILFKNKNGEYILHRIYTIKDMKYRTIGDYCLNDDGQVEQTNIIGVVEKIMRKDRIIACDSFLWQIFTRVWLALLPVRKYLIMAHKIFIKVKARVRKCGYYFFCKYLTCIRFINKEGWLSRHD
jgi:signal peptidase I